MPSEVKLSKTTIDNSYRLILTWHLEFDITATDLDFKQSVEGIPLVGDWEIAVKCTDGAVDVSLNWGAGVTAGAFGEKVELKLELQRVTDEGVASKVCSVGDCTPLPAIDPSTGDIYGGEQFSIERADTVELNQRTNGRYDPALYKGDQSVTNDGGRFEAVLLLELLGRDATNATLNGLECSTSCGAWISGLSTCSTTDDITALPCACEEERTSAMSGCAACLGGDDIGRAGAFDAYCDSLISRCNNAPFTLSSTTPAPVSPPSAFSSPPSTSSSASATSTSTTVVYTSSPPAPTTTAQLLVASATPTSTSTSSGNSAVRFELFLFLSGFLPFIVL